MGEEGIIPEWASRTPMPTISDVSQGLLDNAPKAQWDNYVDSLNQLDKDRFRTDRLRELNRAGWERYHNNTIGDLNRSIAIQNGVTAGLGIMSGINGMLSPALAASKVNETPVFNNNLNALRAASSRDYSNYNQLMRSYHDFNNSIGLDYTKVRGMDDMQKIGTIGSSALSGALTLGSVAPGWGHALGAAAGAAIGTFGVATGNTIAYNNTKTGNLNLGIAKKDFELNNVEQADNIGEHNYRSSQNNVAARGGKFNTVREQESIQQFANRVLHRKDSILPKRTYQKGGVCVKIRTK